MASAKAKRAKRIVQIKLEAPKKRLIKASKTRKKNNKKVVIKHRRDDHEIVIEPIKDSKKLSNRGIRKEWSQKKSKKKARKRSVAAKTTDKKRKPNSEKMEDESQLKDADLDNILKTMKGSSEAELLTEYEGSF